MSCYVTCKQNKKLVYSLRENCLKCVLLEVNIVDCVLCVLHLSVVIFLSSHSISMTPKFCPVSGLTP